MSELLLKNFLIINKEELSKELYRKLANLQWNSWQEFFLRTELGRKRFDTWISLLIDSIDEKKGPEIFFSDQTHAAYERAIQGYQFKDFSMLYLCALNSVKELISKEKPHRAAMLYRDFYILFEILLKGILIVSTQTLKTREEILNEKVFHLESLHNFTQEIIKSLDWKDIVKVILRKSQSIFKARKCYIILKLDQYSNSIEFCTRGKIPKFIVKIMSDSFHLTKNFFVDAEGNIHDKINPKYPARLISVPIRAHATFYGVLAIDAGKNGFILSSKELDLLYQVVYISAIALENSFMFEEIERSRQELRHLTEKMITIQEEERRHLASDIHDSLAQVLTGIGYKIQVCRELLDRDPGLLYDKLDNVTKIVDRAVDQSRELISSLRPDLLDDVGLIAALKRYVENYSRDTAIEIRTDLPDHIQLSPEITICLFRVVQEAFSNIFKHSESKYAELVIKKINGNIILNVSDYGKGFETSSYGKGESGFKIGILSMKERVEALGGKININSGIDKGCHIEVKIEI